MKIIVTTTSLPVSDDDKVPAFVKDQSIELKKRYPKTNIVIHAPHNAHSQTSTKQKGNSYYQEAWFHYFWPYKWELLTGRGILPALRQNKLLYPLIPFLFFFQFTSLLSLVRKEKADLIYAHWFTPQAINACLVSKLTGVPFVFTTHASDVSVLGRIPFTKKLVSWVCRNAKAYTAVSDRTANKLMAFFDPDTWKRDYASKLSIIPMGVKTDLPTVSSADIAATKKAYSIPEGKRYLLSLGRLAEKKGITYLLQAFASLPATTTDDMQLIIAGDGQLKSILEKESKDLGIHSITFTGYAHGKNKDALFAMADYVCLPSIVDDSGDSEGFPVAIMESLAAGKVVLVSDATGAETILEDGVSGFVFPQKSIDPLAKSITQAMQLNKSSRARMQQKSKTLAKQFDWSRITDEHHKILKKAIQ